jgi:hypothetical protein
MEYLVTMTTHVPEGTADETVAAEFQTTPLTPHPSDPGCQHVTQRTVTGCGFRPNYLERARGDCPGR